MQQLKASTVRGLIPKPRLKGEAVKTSLRRAQSRCSQTKELRTEDANDEKK